MSQPFAGEIRAFSFNFPPRNWAACAGQLLAINQNQALFALLSTQYGGDGRTTFGLPDLRGRAAMGTVGPQTQGQTGGAESVILTTAQIPSHTHPALASSTDPTTDNPSGQSWAPNAASTILSYGPANSPLSQMSASALGETGSNLPHENMQPYLVVNFCIAIRGVFPSRN